VTAEAGKSVRLRDQMQNGRGDALAAFDLLEFELVAPGDEGAPEKLVCGDDDEDHHHEPPGDGDAIACVGGGLEVGAEAGKAKVARTKVEHLARHQEEPGARDGHDGVPDETDCRVGQLQLEETLDPREAVDSRRFHQFLRDALERGVEAEGHVPYRAREDEDDRSHLNAELPGREQRDHGQHHGR
jgi:hypothetical protein